MVRFIRSCYYTVMVQLQIQAYLSNHTGTIEHAHNVVVGQVIRMRVCVGHDEKKIHPTIIVQTFFVYNR